MNYIQPSNFNKHFLYLSFFESLLDKGLRTPLEVNVL